MTQAVSRKAATPNQIAASAAERKERLADLGRAVLSGIPKPTARQEHAAVKHLMRLEAQHTAALAAEREAGEKLARSGSADFKVNQEALRTARGARADISMQLTTFNAPNPSGETVTARIKAAKANGKRAKELAMKEAPQPPGSRGRDLASEAAVRAELRADHAKQQQLLNATPAPNWDFGHTGNHLRNP